MGKININYNNGAIGGVIPSEDFISALVFDSSVLPSGFSSSDRVKQVYSLNDAENLGITSTSVGETIATGGNIDITAIGAIGDYVKVYVTPKNNVSTLIGTYVVKSGDTTVNAMDSLIANINLNTATTGWSASAVSSPTTSIDLHAPAGLGASINGENVITTSSKTGTTFAITITNFANGVGSIIDVMHYVIDSFFKASPSGKLWLGVYDFTAGFDAAKLAELQSRSGGEVRQMGVFTKKTLDNAASIITSINTVAVDQASKHKPFSTVLALQPGTITGSTTVNIRSLNASAVSVTLGNEYGVTAKGYQLFGTSGLYPTDLGAIIGHISRSKVSNSIAWVERNATQYDDIMLITGEHWLDIEDTTIPVELFNKGYIFERHYLGLAGSYFDNASVADVFTSDYDSIQRRRTIDKAARIAYTTLLPYLSSPVTLNAKTGALSTDSIISFVSVLNSQFDTMASNLEISGYKVYIDPTQNLLATKNLIITLKIVPIASADTITVNLGFALSIQ